MFVGYFIQISDKKRKIGNDKIAHYPSRLIKILCVSKKKFKRLKTFLATIKKKKNKRSQISKLFKNPAKRKTKVVRFNNGVSYEASNMAQAYESTRWQWTRVNQWFKDHKEDYSLS